LPLLSFGPSAIVSGSAYLLSPPFGMECLTSLAEVASGMRLEFGFAHSPGT
jgi:hypothetical protein